MINQELVNKMKQDLKTSGYVPTAPANDWRTRVISGMNEAPESFMEKAGGVVRSAINLPKTVGASFGEKMYDTVSGNMKEAGTALSTVKPTLGSMGETASKVFEAGTGIVAAPVTAAVESLIPEPAKKAIGSAVSGVGDFFKGLAPEVAESWTKVEEEHPELANTLKNLLGAGMNTLALTGAEVTPLKALSPTSVVEKGIKGGKLVKDIVTKPIDAIKSIKKSTAIKTHEEIAAVPEKEVYKLNSVDRKIRDDIDNTAIAEKHMNETNELKKKFESTENITEVEKTKQLESLAKKQEQEASSVKQKIIEREQNAKDILEKQKSEVESEMDTLVKDYERGALEKTVEIRPKIVEGLRRESDVFESMADEAFAQSPAGGKAALNTKSISNKIDSFCKDDTTGALAREIKDGLGIVEGETITARDFYNNMKAMKQELSGSAKSGNRVYTSKEYTLTKVLSESAEELKKVGVDLSDANKFWRKHAEKRDEIVKKVKPFKVTEQAAGPFADILKQHVEGKVKAIRSENIIKNVEDLIGEPVTNEAKIAYSKFADKKKIAENLNEEISNIGKMTKAETDAAIKNIEQKYSSLTEAQKANFDEIAGMQKGQFQKELADLKAAQEIESAGLKTAQQTTAQLARRLGIKKQLIKYAFWAAGMFSVGRGASMFL